MPPVVAIIGKKNCGKTTLIEKLIPALADLGYKVGTIKHHHGAIRMDTPGKDTWRHKQAGAQAVMLASPTGLGFICDTPNEIPLTKLVGLYFTDVDLVLVEGYKQEVLPKVEIFRSAVHTAPLPDPGEKLIAVISDMETTRKIPHFGLTEVGPLAEFLVEHILQ